MVEPTDQDKARREEIIADGGDPDDPITVAKYREWQNRVETGGITKQDAEREKYKFFWDQEDKKIREAAQKEKIDWYRYTHDGEYKRQIDEQDRRQKELEREQAQQLNRNDGRPR